MSLSDSTINGWLSGGIQLLQVLYDKQKELLLSSGDIQKDETPIKVGDGSKKGRSASVPLAFLKDNQGYLQTFGCMAHARRFFIQARDNDNKRSDHVVSELQLLYRLEEEGSEDKAEAEEIYTRRQAIAMSTGRLARWTKLMAYAPDGVLLIDNNRIENQIRPVSVGRNKEQP